MADGPRIVLAIDYGTTYTGLAWAAQRGSLSPIALGDVKVFMKWPGKSGRLKVPSAYSYSRGRCSQWGYDIEPGSKTFIWTKLALTYGTPEEELKVLRDLMEGLDFMSGLKKSNGQAGLIDVPEHLTKSPEDVITDYLTKVSREWYRLISAEATHLLENIPLDIVMTHPVNWPYEAVNKTYRAVMAAFPKLMYGNVRDVYMTTEPEACALYTVTELLAEQHNTLIPGDCFVLCDAGGGTVDVASYVLESLSPLKMTRVGGLKGKRCGATCIDRAFLQWYSKKFKRSDIIDDDSSAGGHINLTETGRELLESFERHKTHFTGRETADIEVPEGFDDSSVISDSGVISLSTNDLVSIFSESVDGTLELLSKQIFEAKGAMHGGRRCHVSTIFLAGGLSENPYLVNKVKSFALENGSIAVKKAKDGWSAVVQGAVLTGAGTGATVPAPVQRIPRYYGVCMSEIYQDWKDGGADQLATDWYNGKQIVPDAITWLVRQGDVVLPGTNLERDFAVDCKFTSDMYKNGSSARITFVAARVDDWGHGAGPPTRLVQIDQKKNTVAHLDIPVTTFDIGELSKEHRAKGRGKYYTARINVKIRVSKKVKVDVEYKGKSVEAFDTLL
ncbi:hypothetical protein BDV95DRAFT_584773 [Massariosphaeria phaeospora]|uniref:Actin-like ATPase domain-containing protein n=1 Tax=Massariosphaeria phaeospora TaxID=100035 RepID=A0A7C8MCM9_9PLEO|nr:hypothetical protein BDV95DRAFT_584773 [Massariosphaeria phaeospora]